VGDVHGHVEKLQALLPQLAARAEPGDALVFVGDYIDRGPDSRGVVDRVLEQVRGAWNGPVTTLMGNHEEMMLDYLSPEPRYDPFVWIQNGGMQTIDSYTGGEWEIHLADALPPEHLAFFEGLERWHEDENGIYVHAGLLPGEPPEAATDEVRLWVRELFIGSSYQWEKVVVFGHTPQFEPHRGLFANRKKMKWRPLDRPEKIGIDTGAAYGGPLTAVILPDREFLSAQEQETPGESDR
jgi:serine/threonine protein phosphatase 1